MKTTSQTTYILLDRGTEDVQLYNELLKIQAKLAKDCYKSYKDFYKDFPKFSELKQALYYEITVDK